MHPSVRAQFLNFNKPFEGTVEYMYLDIIGKVTIGIGNLIDPVERAVADLTPLNPFFKNDTARIAGPLEITAEWVAVKARQDLAVQGHTHFRDITELRLSQSAIESLVDRRLTTTEAGLKQTPEFASLDSWPADAQLGLLSMGWAMGAAFAQGAQWPNFQAAVQAQDWDAAAQNCTIREAGNPGVIPRNRADRILFTNAARVIERGLPLDTLQYPAILTPGVSPVFPPGGGGGPVSEGWPVLREGSTAVIVTTLQFLLQEQGFAVDLDGIFSPALTAFVKDFQATNGLTSDGVVGKNTWSKLTVRRRLGDSGAAVKAIQERLLFWDVGLDFPDFGLFDGTTDISVRAFQTATNLTADGDVGPNTWKALINF